MTRNPNPPKRTPHTGTQRRNGIDMSDNKLKRIEAAIKLLYPEEMTPTAKRILTQILDEESEAQ